MIEFLKKYILFTTLILIVTPVIAQTENRLDTKTALSTTVKGYSQINPTTVEVIFSDERRLTFDFYGENIFRVFEDTSGGIVRDPVAIPPAQILVNNPRKNIAALKIENKNGQIQIQSLRIIAVIDKNNGLLKVFNRKTNKLAFQTLDPIHFERNKVSLTLKENPDEYFFGGGVQNGRFAHKGKSIAIENQNSWTDNGVASPTPFYWSSAGYGMMWYTFNSGKYDFGNKEKGKVVLMHNTDYLDVFFLVDDGAEALLSDFYQLTGNPILLPKFGFYEGHLNAYNRDYWKEDSTGTLFEDGIRYRESQKDNAGIKESLNGEKNNYQFSARAVIDRYHEHDMPLGWILPNDGYGAGYGQTSSLDSNIANLKSFGDYARKNGVQIGLWTQSDLHPKAGTSALLQRDMVKEVRDAGVRVLKTDVAWVGQGYSFGLNGVSEVGGHIMPYYGNNARPFIISLDGWAGTQRYAGVWTGDQTGGQWEYIRFHIPTYIGSGLSGQPNITSDMDGIFGGKNSFVNIRDFQWKTFTPMQLNMDGWGMNEKYPHALGEPAASINRNYLKWKAQLIPYTYSVARQAVDGLPIMRALFLENPNPYTLGKRTQYEYLYGPYFLLAPIYQNTQMDKEGNDIRNNIYLPNGDWYDYFTGEKFEGGKIINSFNAPIWKLPVFIKSGAIIPLTNPNNNVAEINHALRIYELYPTSHSSFMEYDDDGTTEAYKLGQSVTTEIVSSIEKNGQIAISILPSKGNFNGFIKNKSTEFRINIYEPPTKITAQVNGRTVLLRAVYSRSELEANSDVFFYDPTPNLNFFGTKGSNFSTVKMIKNPLLYVKLKSLDITKSTIVLNISGYHFSIPNKTLTHTGMLTKPAHFGVNSTNTNAYSLRPSWGSVVNADYYEIKYNGMLYSTIKDTSFLFDGLQPMTEYTFQLRAANKTNVSDWYTIVARTGENPLEYAIKNISAKSSASDEEGNEIGKLVDFDEDNMWHTSWAKKTVPFEVILDLRSINHLDQLQYLPRLSGVNGILLQGKISYSINKKSWDSAGSFNWERTPDIKSFSFPTHPTARYIKFSVDKAYGNFGSGRELYVFKVPGSATLLPGDINNDGKIDQNDLTSYMNYTGLRSGDGDFEGYISKGDINENGLIDAYDISNVATQLDGGVNNSLDADSVSGKLVLFSERMKYQKGENIVLQVKGTDLKNVNALSFALSYNTEDYEFVGIHPIAISSMTNMTYDRLHSNGQKSLYPTFINIGDQPVLNGSENLFTIELKAKRDLNFNLKLTDGILVDKQLDCISF